MNEVAETEAETRPSVWLRIWQFPLVVMTVSLVLLIGVSLVAQAFAQSTLRRSLGDELGLAVGVSILVVLSLIAYKLVIRRLGAKKHDDLPLAPALKDTALGFAGGAALISICVALAALSGVYRIEGTDGFEDWARILFLFGIYAGFFEELILRGIVFRFVEELAGSWIALALSSLLFGFLHATNENATFFSSLAIAIEAGILLGAAYMLTRSLWLAIGIHAGWNVFQALWDVPVSGNDVSSFVDARLEGPSLLAGGGFGLEATVFALVVATGAGIWMLVLAIRKGRVVKPAWRRKGQPITAY